MKDINEIMLNPVRVRIIQELALKQSMTTTELCERISDVPRTTVYRHVNVLLENHFLTVVSEKKIRGSLERTLSLNVSEISKHNTLENASQNALSFLISKYAKFHKHLNRENPEEGKGIYFFNNTIMMMNDNEFNSFLSELRELLIKYSYKPAEGRTPRDISVLSTPVEDI